MSKVATAEHDWIHEVSRRFTRATGWPMAYTPIEIGADAAQAAAVQNDPECCWFSEVRAGLQTVGLLHLKLPQNSRCDRVFSAVRDLAEIYSRLITRCLSAAQLAESRTKEMATLVDIGRSLPGEEDLLAALRQLLRAAVELTGFRCGAFFLLGSSTSELKLRVVESAEMHEIPAARRELAESPPDLNALAGRRVLLHRKSGSVADQWLPQACSTAVCLAVQSETAPLGTMWVFDRRLRVPGHREVHVLESIAAQIAAVLERVVLLQESAVKHRLQRDLEVASESQTRNILGELSADLGFDVAAACTSRYELGGDLCELIPLNADLTAVAVGDASGDSVPAAMVMSAVRGALRTLAIGEPLGSLRTGAVIQKLNRVLHTVTPAHQFMSMLYGVLNRTQSTFTYSNAGHPVPIHFHGGSATKLESHGMLLGVLRESVYSFSTVKLVAGDLLVIYSDGISEAMNRRRMMFRSEGIIGAVRKHMAKPAHEIVQAIWANLEHHLGDHAADDRTLLVVKVPG